MSQLFNEEDEKIQDLNTGTACKLPYLIAHRGYSHIAPENTIVAFKKAIGLGFWGCETDIRMTVDGHWVCMHDATLDRTTNGTGPVEAMTLAEARQLDAGSWHDSRFAGEQIPTLEEYLHICRLGRLVSYVEIKGPARSTQDLERVVLAIDDQIGLRNSVIISFSLTHLKCIRQISKDVRLGYLTMAEVDSVMLNEVISLENAFLDAYHRFVTAASMGLARSSGVSVECWTVDTCQDAREKISYGVAGITSNAISDLRQLV
jgi:glycerophosphoryl diester phosphodiesterase